MPRTAVKGQEPKEWNTAEMEQVVQSEWEFGAHLEADRLGYCHHGIYVGNGQVVHYANPDGGDSSSDETFFLLLGANSDVNQIHVSSLEHLEDGHPTRQIEYPWECVYPPLKVVARALSRVGEDGYNLFGSNCEHFARWCMIAESDSLQINRIRNAFLGAGRAITDTMTLPMVVVGTASGGIILGSGLAFASAVKGFIKGWLEKQSLPKLPVYREFFEYSTTLYNELNGKHPFGESFLHASQDDRKSYELLPDLNDEFILFVYKGNFWIGEQKDWLVTERGICDPWKERYISMHEITEIKPGLRSIKILKTDGTWVRLRCLYAHPASVVEFLKSSIACTPLTVKKVRRSSLGLVKQAFNLSVGAGMILLIIWWLLPSWLWLVSIILFCAIAFALYDNKKS